MALSDLLAQGLQPSDNLFTAIGRSKTADFVKDEVSKDRVWNTLDEVRDLIAFYREYPDVFVDDIKGPDCGFRFRDTQRTFLRAVMRYKYVYCVFPRG